MTLNHACLLVESLFAFGLSVLENKFGIAALFVFVVGARFGLDLGVVFSAGALLFAKRGWVVFFHAGQKNADILLLVMQIITKIY